MDRIDVKGFAELVHGIRPQWPADYVEKEAGSVLDGAYESVCPAAGSDIFYVRKEGDAVIASTRPKGQELKGFELIA